LFKSKVNDKDKVITLNKLKEIDLPLVLAWRNAPEVRQYMYLTHEISEAEHHAWFIRMKHDPQALWYIHQDENGKSNGVVYFTQYQPENRSAFWGFYTAPDTLVGTGTKLGLSALDEAFNVLNLHKLNAEVISTNERSLHFHDKLGFYREGFFRDYHFNGEHYLDVVRLGILQSEWLKKRPEIENIIAKYDVTI
jgi:UDP-4-amino-4,6-dideoxy-N-acetyl-beta-L-altrosamine N-acetyltransferase